MAKEKIGQFANGMEGFVGVVDTPPVSTPTTPPPSTPTPTPERYPRIPLATQPETKPTPVPAPLAPEKPKTEQELIDERRRQSQDAINSITASFASKIDKENEAGQIRTREENALNVSRGLVGSPDAATAMKRTDDYNKKQIQGIEEEKAATIAKILFDIDNKARDDAQKLQTQYRNDYEAYRTGIKGESEQRKTEAQGLFNTLSSNVGKSWEDFVKIQPDQAKYLLDNLGWDYLQAELLCNSNKSKGEQIQWNDQLTHYDEKNGMMVMGGVDPKTGQLVTRSYKVQLPEVPENTRLTPQVIGKQLFFVPKDGVDPSKPIKDQIIPYGGLGQFFPSSEGSGNTFKFGTNEKGQLIAAGFNQADIERIQEDLKTYDLATITEGMDDKQKKALSSIVGGASYTQMQKDEQAGKQFLTKDSFKNLFGEDQLAQAAKEAGIMTKVSWGRDKPDVEGYLDSLMKKVEFYRQSGYPDQKILEMMQ